MKTPFAFRRLLGLMLLLSGFMTDEGRANPVLAPRRADVDKRHTGQDENGAFLGIAADEANRCWQAAFANALYTLDVTNDAEALYRANWDRWPNERKKGAEATALFNDYFQDSALNLVATLYLLPEISSAAFARQQSAAGQAVLLGIDDDKHLVNFQGWDDSLGYGQSILSDSDGDYGDKDLTWWSDGVVQGAWRLSYSNGPYGKTGLVSSLITICRVPEAPTAALFPALFLVLAVLRMPTPRQDGAFNGNRVASHPSR